MNGSEMYCAVIESGKGETVKLDGGAEDLLSAMRELKQDGIPVYGCIELNLSYFKGTNILKINLDDAKAVFKVFNRFTKTDSGKFNKPVIDAENNGLISTDGRNMLVCRIPSGFPIAEAVPSGFSADVPFRWKEIAEELEPTDFNLLCFRRMATIRNGDERHGFLQAIRGAVKTYEHDGFFHAPFLRIGEKFYDVKWIVEIVESLFNLGCTMVTFHEKTFLGACSVYSPMHIFGYGGEIDAKGIVMPIRADDSMGAFVMPLDSTENRK